jgi:integrase
MAHTRQATLIETELQATLSRFAAYLMGTRVERRRKLRGATARSYATHVLAFLRWAGRLDPTVADSQAFLEHLGSDYRTAAGQALADSSKRSAFFAIKAFWEFKRQPLTEEQEKGFLVPPTPKNARDAPLSMERIQELLGRMPDPRRYALIRTLLATGIRRAELAALKVKHVDFAGRKVWVPEVGEDGRAAAKGGSGGWVCISQVALDAIQEHLRRRLKPSGSDPEAPLFESLQTYGHLTPDGVTDLVGSLTESILGQRVTPHELRHAFASHAAAGGEGRPPMPIIALQLQLRHKDPNTTLRYIHGVGAVDEAYARSAPAF